MEYGAAGVAESLVCDGSTIRLIGQLVWSYDRYMGEFACF
jgi:hypothetical protein